MSNELISTPETYCGVYVDSPRVRRVWFEADSVEHAQRICERWGLGYQGPQTPPESQAEPPPVSVDEATARRLWGGVSRSTLYRILVRGELERDDSSRRLLVKLASIERRR